MTTFRTVIPDGRKPEPGTIERIDRQQTRKDAATRERPHPPESDTSHPAPLDATLLATYLRQAHGPHAGQEVLLRALACERRLNRVAAHFWLSIYDRVVRG